MQLVAKSEKVKSVRRRVIALTVILSLILLSIIGLFVALGIHLNSRNTVFPNVWYEGIDMSGLTREQVRQILINNGYEQRAANISLTVNLPFDISYTVNGDEAGLTLNADEAAGAIIGYGRSGNFLSTELSFISAFIGMVELTELSLPDYDNTVMRALAVEHAEVFNSLLFQSGYEVTDTHIKIIKGTNFLPVTADELLRFTEREFSNAMEQHSHVEANFQPRPDASDTVDMQAIFDRFHEEPVSSYYDPLLGNPNSEMYDPINRGATESKAGRSFDLEGAIAAYNSLKNGDTLLIPITFTEPELTQADLAARLFGDVLAEVNVVAVSPDSNRNTNIRLSSEAIDGLVMQPGDVFSYNDVVGPRTRARGYLLGNSFESGEIVQTIGGGICQVSSAIYYALLHTDLEIVHRRPHGMTVSYLAGGLDATVDFGTIDFRFRNNTEYPIRLDVTSFGSVTVTVRIHGTRTSDVYYRVESQLMTVTEIEEVTREATPEEMEALAARGIHLEPQQQHLLSSGARGSSHTVWRYHYSDQELENPVLDENGDPFRERLKTDVYRMRQRVTVYNPENAPPPEQNPAPPTAVHPPAEPPPPPPPENNTGEG